MRTGFLKHFTKSLKDRSGNVAVIFAGTVSVLLFVAGSGIDLANFLNARQNTLAALDSAILSASVEVRDNGSTVATAEARGAELLRANLQGNQLWDVDAVANSFEFTQTPGLTPGSFQFTGTVDLEVQTLFATIFGFDSLGAELEAATGYNEPILEVAFVLDVTGSMGGSILNQNIRNGERINTLKSAMRSTIARLLPNNGVNDDRVRVSLIPYSSSVNLGSFHEAAVSPLSPSAARPSCVTEREGQSDIADVAPVPTINGRPNDTHYETDTASGNGCPPVPIIPLTNNRGTLISAVNSFVASGSTAGHIGIEWGFNTLSESWSAFWPLNARPTQYGTANVQKILVIMTDGVFNTVYIDGEENANRTRQTALSNQRALEFCDLAKGPQRDIEVFTIAFGTDGDPNNFGSAEQLLSDCATPDVDPNDQHFFIADRASELEAAFAAIIEQIPQINLTQ